MPKNKGKGGKNRRRGKNENDRDKRELIMKEEGQEYGQVTKILGNGYVETLSFDGTKRRCHIRGKMRKKVWVNNGDIVLMGLRDYQKDFGDIIVKYTSEEAKLLKSFKELPENLIVMEGNDQMNTMEDQDITFDLTAPDEYEVPLQRGGYDFPSSGTESDVSHNEGDDEGDNL